MERHAANRITVEPPGVDDQQALPRHRSPEPRELERRGSAGLDLDPWPVSTHEIDLLGIGAPEQRVQRRRVTRLGGPSEELGRHPRQGR